MIKWLAGSLARRLLSNELRLSLNILLILIVKVDVVLQILLDFEFGGADRLVVQLVNEAKDYLIVGLLLLSISISSRV